MKNFIVEEKEISLAGVTTLLVQGEIYPEEIRFKFNSKDEHTRLASITDWKIWYKNADNDTHYVALSKINSETDNTWTLCWNVEANATEILGNLSIGIVGQAENLIWKTLPCNVKVAYGIEDIIQDIEL